MNRAIKNLRGLLTVTFAWSLLALTEGCSSNNHASAVAPAPLSVPENSRSIDMPVNPNSTTSVNNAADLAKAQSEDDFNAKTTARDVDLGGGNATSGQPLTYESLGAVLQKMGVNPVDNKTYYEMDVKATTTDNMAWTFPIIVEFSTDQTEIWIQCSLYTIDKNGTPNIQSLMNVLSANEKLGGNFFGVADNHMLIFQQAFANVGVTPQLLGANLKNFFDCLKDGEPVFKMFFAQPSSGGGSGGGSTLPSPFQ